MHANANIQMQPAKSAPFTHLSPPTHPHLGLMLWQEDYELLEDLGHGQFGRVVRAVHRVSGTVVVVKQVILQGRAWGRVCIMQCRSASSYQII